MAKTNELSINSKLLDGFSILHWSKVKVWEYTDAILLSMGYDPKGYAETQLSKSLAKMIEDSQAEVEFVHNNPNPARFVGEQFQRITDIVNSSMRDNSLKYNVIKSEDELTGEENTTCDFNALDFCIWAKVNLPSFPDELYDAVVSPQGDSKPAGEKKSSGSNAGADARWADRKEIIAKAEAYVKKALKDGCKECDHLQLADYMYSNACDDNGEILFSYPDIDEELLESWLQEGAKNVLKDYPGRIVGIKGYLKSDGACDLHPVKR